MSYDNWVFGKDGALLSAAAQGKEQLVKSLLEEGASVDVTSPNGFTALHRAAEHGHADTVALLLANGAKVDTKASDESSPLSAARKCGHDRIAQQIEEHL